MFGKTDKPHTPKTKLKLKKKLLLVRLRPHRSKIKLNKNPKLSNVCLVKQRIQLTQVMRERVSKIMTELNKNQILSIIIMFVKTDNSIELKHILQK